MILNEDFFNDIEIKDEDLTVEKPNQTLKEYNEKTSRELIEHKISESEMVLFISIECPENFNICHRIERIMKRVKYMFDIYNINISEPFLTYRKLSFKILKDKEFPDNYTIIQHEGCNLYFPEDELREYGADETIRNESLNLFVFLDKKIPVFMTARSAYNFAVSLDKCIWKDVTNPKYDCFCWYDIYNINDIYYGGAVIESFADNNSYVTDNAIKIFETIIRLVPEELAKQLRNIERSKFANKILKKNDIKNIIKMTEQ